MHTHQYTVKSFDKENIAMRKISGDFEDTTAILFVHGLGGDQIAWDFTIEKLFDLPQSKTISIYTFDLRGHGQSTRKIPMGESIFVTQARDLSAVIEAMLREHSYKNVIVVGHSLGSFVVQQYARLFLHSQVKKIVLVSAPSKSMGWKMPSWITRTLRYFPTTMPVMRNRKDHEVFRGSADFYPKRLWSDMRSVGLRCYLVLQSLVSGQSVETTQDSLPIDTIIVTGDNDLYFSLTEMTRFQKKVQAKRMIVFPGANHLIPLNHPELLAQTLLSVADEEERHL
ncbi:MAG: alpha/beta hydrolase [Candidatus Woesebacteria bacterium]